MWHPLRDWLLLQASARTCLQDLSGDARGHIVMTRGLPTMIRLRNLSLLSAGLSLMLLVPLPASAQRGGRMGGGGRAGGFGSGFSRGSVGGFRGGFSRGSIGSFRGGFSRGSVGTFRGGFGTGRGGFFGNRSFFNRSFFFPRRSYYFPFSFGFYGYPDYAFFGPFGFDYWPYYSYWYPPVYDYYPAYTLGTYGSAPPYVGNDQSAPRSYSAQTYWLIALKDSTILAVKEYWLEGSDLHYTTVQGKDGSVAYSQVDLNLTRQLNRERGMEFRTPQTKTSYQPRRYDAYGNRGRSPISQ